ncbi:hypothetical protein PpBr36_02485 [Pyricularia pennisetigena]|uniref:hypothetical protein n=1 Tax=Pyricularia pennisetigena TaxID=1578925 RepID=UPI00115280BC|nr:hypothetical protein PpBr36_02485 [Pyricularia pennisetigena]TLS30501.1 hypothetical protein PpBr36_02485 [Pyricularia pennisetigena]
MQFGSLVFAMALLAFQATSVAAAGRWCKAQIMEGHKTEVKAISVEKWTNADIGSKGLRMQSRL